MKLAETSREPITIRRTWRNGTTNDMPIDAAAANVAENTRADRAAVRTKLMRGEEVATELAKFKRVWG